MEGRFLLDVIVGKCSAVLKLLACEDQALLVWRDAFLVLNLGLDVVDGIGRLDLESNGLVIVSDLLFATRYRKLLTLPVRVLTKICIVAEFVSRDRCLCEGMNIRPKTVV
jgi:hypothetical protein